MHNKILPLVSPYRINVVKSRSKKEELNRVIKDQELITVFNLPEHLKSSSGTLSSSNKLKVRDEKEDSRNIQSPFMQISPNEQSKKNYSLVSLGGFKYASQIRGYLDYSASGRKERSLKLISPIYGKVSKSTFSASNRLRGEFLSPSSPKSVQKEMSFVDSPIGPLVFSNILQIIQQPSPTLSYLNLENTGITDKNIKTLCEALNNDKTLKFMGLARNSLTFRSCKNIKELLKENYHLQKLDLHWNSIKDSGCAEIFEGLCSNETLKELDLSWNGIGSCKDLRNIRRMANSFANFLGLAHLDLSFNHMTSNECEILGKGLEKNQKILGIHIVGNEGKIDSLGFLHPHASQVNIKESHFFSRIFQKKKKNLKRLKSLCWLCEKWVEFCLELRFDKFPEQYLKSEVFVHFEFDDYKADLLNRTESGFFLVRALPEGSQRIFFSFPGTVFSLPGLETQILPESITQFVQYEKNSIQQIHTKTVNLINVAGFPCSYKRPLKTFPRRQRFSHSALSLRPTKTVWSVELSIFKDFKFLTRPLISDCLLFDWSQSRLSKLIKKEDEQQQFQNLLLIHYENIIETFKYLAIQSGNEIPSIGSNIFTDFLSQKALFDEFYEPSDLGVNWSAVKTSKFRQPYSPGNALVRYEFTEMLVRVAIDRYLRHKRVKNAFQGFQFLLAEGLEDLLKVNNSQVWRNEKMLNKEVDVVLKMFKPVLETVFKEYSGGKTLPRQKDFMCLEEFKKVFVEAKVLDSSAKSRDVEGCFYLAMGVEVDELFERKHMEMSFLEFLEGVCRICEISYVWSGSKSFKHKLSTCCRLLVDLCPKSVLDRFIVPSKEALKELISEFH